jgi:wyosine [tRNA(Phe)-imidazoG37] synthetase (radical SAM superfamily)
MLPSHLVSGPAMSHRFGRSLRVDIVGGQSAVCSFSCAYCRSKEREMQPPGGWVDPAALVDGVRAALQRDPVLDHIVIAGNGEPTRHPAFEPIVDGILKVRQQLAPAARLAVVSNGSELYRFEVREALARADVRLMKLDAGDATTFRVISGACLSLGWLVGQLRMLGGVTLLARFVRNSAKSIDNTSQAAILAWLKTVERIRPLAVQVSGQDWESHHSLVDVPRAELEAIAARVQGIGIPAAVI